MTANKVCSWLHNSFFVATSRLWKLLTFPSSFCFFNTNPSSISKQKKGTWFLYHVWVFPPQPPMLKLAYCPWARQDPTTQVKFLKDFYLISGGWGRKWIFFIISILNPDLSLLTSSEINLQTKAVDHTVSSSSSQMKDGSLRKSFCFVVYNFSR